MENKKILIVEDQQDIADLVRLHLGDLGAEVTHAVDGHEGMRMACAMDWDLMILDIQLPGPSGLEICRAVRRNEAFVPILLLTSRSSELDRVLGLDIGADDYITKPFSVMELIARIKAVFRRVEALEPKEQQVTESIDLGRLTINDELHQVRLGEELVDLTAREFDLLRHFAAQPGRVFRRSELLDSVWGYGHDGYEHTVNSHINRLRAKIEKDPNNPEIIVTVWGVGYKLDAQALQAS
ncbi:response regulator transcription factor [Pseudoteredinibacter isoporae]|uniref:Phosphate regulon transcriptional regulatory protein PhoB n=1 Tax=Pseudoteredinibacter isoporae TaxID=570281 RepID=A0A7X0JUI0_9GAMM|nr:response regulator transcription factor [Pseudoteredinibacter isoporae]MBB6521621.1 DNA-binding response OmpR family regulator [Pseudoteredinibacter isoporae]NHO87175.1 response regulator transcription factor [Pseudoteredinibacter isoporae]NIB22999.1 response regulator transcription factor [Pseudoteredinibacter isoporae]